MSYRVAVQCTGILSRIVDRIVAASAGAAGAAVLMVTHSPRHAARMGRALHLSAGRLAPEAASARAVS